MRISDWSSDVCSSDLIIEPVDADDQAAADPALAHALLHVAGGGAACAGDEILRVDSDRAGDRADRAPADGQRVVRPQRATHLMRHVMAERFEPFLGLEPDHVIGEQRLDQPAMRSEEHTSELQSLMRISYAVFFL